ncbi:hypothetical protein QF028_002250 [Neobacillus sp. B4I6]
MYALCREKALLTFIAHFVRTVHKFSKNRIAGLLCRISNIIKS